MKSRISGSALVLCGLLALALACGVPSLPESLRTPTAPPRTPTPRASTTPLPATVEPTATATPQPAPTFTPTPLPSPTPTPQDDPRLTATGFHLFPWPLYAGDLLSVDVDPVLAGVEGDTSVALILGDGADFTANVELSGLDNVERARFYWIAQLPVTATSEALTLTLQLPKNAIDDNPENNRLALTVPLRPRDSLPPPELETSWAVTETVGFRLHYLTHSAAARDLDKIIVEAGAAYTDVSSRLGASSDAVEIYLLDRVLGQGGYASSDWVAISYVDRQYSPTSLGTVLRHELTHRLDKGIGCEAAPAMFREGLAVYVAGGHYRPEPLREKAAVLLSSPRYVPLGALVEDFYTHQHEVGYLEAGTVVQYIVAHYGWDELSKICAASADVKDGNDEARWQAMVAALGLPDTAALEANWQAWLGEVSVTPEREALVGLEFQLMDEMRAYQLAYDPSAHFLEGILFSPAEGERLGIVADFVRRPREPEPVAIELVLALGQDALVQGDSVLLGMLVDDLGVALDGNPDDAPVIGDAVRITSLALARGWEPYGLIPEAPGRYGLLVLNRDAWPQQAAFEAQHLEDFWRLVGPQYGD